MLPAVDGVVFGVVEVVVTTVDGVIEQVLEPKSQFACSQFNKHFLNSFCTKKLQSQTVSCTKHFPRKSCS